MPNFCLVLNCADDNSKRKDLSFCRVPKVITNQGEKMEILTSERRRKWLSSISRQDLTDKILRNDRVCGEHFHSGKAAPSWDKFNVDWVPSLNMGHQKYTIDEASLQQSREKAKRVSERRKRSLERETDEIVAEKLQKVDEPGVVVKSLFDSTMMDSEMVDIEDIAENLPYNLSHAMTQTKFSTSTAATQTSESYNIMLQPEPLLQRRCSEFDEQFFAGNDDKVKFYTGLPSYEILLKVYSFVECHVERRPRVLSSLQEFAMVLVKLRLAVPHLDLAYRLKIDVSIVSRILCSWLTVMDYCLSPLIKWPENFPLIMTFENFFPSTSFFLANAYGFL